MAQGTIASDVDGIGGRSGAESDGRVDQRPLGVVIFSGLLPATQIAIGGFAPVFLNAARAVIAALTGMIILVGLRQRRPALRDLGPLATVALGVAVGLPLLTALALQHVAAARLVVFGLQPLAGLLLHEPIPPAMIAITAAVAACVAGVKRFA